MDKPTLIEFAETFCGGKLTKAQRDMLRAVASGKKLRIIPPRRTRLIYPLTPEPE